MPLLSPAVLELQKRGITVTELAEAIGVSRSFVSRMLIGIDQIPPERRDAIRRHIGTATANEIFDLIPERSPDDDPAA